MSLPEESRAPGQELRQLPVTAILDNPDNHRSRRFSPTEREEDKELLISVKKLGVLSPLAVVAVGEDSWRVVAGQRRLEAARLVGLEVISAAVLINLEQVDLRAIEIAENAVRQDPCPYDMCRALVRYHETLAFAADGKQRWTQAATAEHIGVTKGRVERAMRGYGKLSDEAHQFIQRHDLLRDGISVRQMIDLATVSDDPQKQVRSAKGILDGLKRKRFGRHQYGNGYSKSFDESNQSSDVSHGTRPEEKRLWHESPLYGNSSYLDACMQVTEADLQGIPWRLKVVVEIDEDYLQPGREDDRHRLGIEISNAVKEVVHADKEGMSFMQDHDRDWIGDSLQKPQ